ncbi:ABC transporter permease [Desulfotomaculum varum]
MKNWLNIASPKPGSLLLPGVTLLLLLAVWEGLVRLSRLPDWLLPPPGRVAGALWQTRGLLWQHSLQTVAETLLGLFLAVAAGVLLATCMEWSYKLRQAVYPLLVISQTVPIIAVAPLFLIWFGYGWLTKVLVVALVCFFPVTVNLADGYRSAEPDMIRLLAAMGATTWQIFRLVKLPAALPYFFSGLRIAGTYSVMGAVIGEWLGASQGLGIYMTRASQSYLTDRVFAAIAVITALSLAIFLLVEGLGRLVMPWHYRAKDIL